MKCAWQAFINLLPVWMRESVDKHGKDKLQELRLRLNAPPELVMQSGSIWLERCVCSEDLMFSVNVASRYSPWTAGTVRHGFITAPGGHRIGMCGNTIYNGGAVTGVHPITSLCIRVARDFPGIGEKAVDCNGSILIIGRPGSGKTTLLRDIIRQKSNSIQGFVSVVDEREEIFPHLHHQSCFPVGRHTDVLSGCSKVNGIEMVLRNMSPQYIAVDEITAQEDCKALLHAGWCGVKLLATAHAGDKNDLYSRPVYRPIIESGIFDYLVTMNPEKSWKTERLVKCQ